MNGFFSIDNIFFTVGQQGISYLEFCAVLFGLSSVLLASFAKVINFYLSFVYSALLFMMFLQKHLYTNMLLQPIMLGICVFGIIRWSRPSENEKDAKNQLMITFLSNKVRLVYLLAMGLFIVLWGMLLQRIHTISSVFPAAQTPYLDAAVAGLMLCAQVLAAQKKWECWVCFLALNIGNVILYINAGLVFMPIVAFCYILFNVIGVIHWRKEWLKQKKLC